MDLIWKGRWQPTAPRERVDLWKVVTSDDSSTLEPKWTLQSNVKGVMINWSVGHQPFALNVIKVISSSAHWHVRIIKQISTNLKRIRTKFMRPVTSRLSVPSVRSRHECSCLLGINQHNNTHVNNIFLTCKPLSLRSQPPKHYFSQQHNPNMNALSVWSQPPKHHSRQQHNPNMSGLVCLESTSKTPLPSTI